MGMSPVISDQFDTVKDVVFAGLCFQSDRRSLRNGGSPRLGSAWLGTAMGTDGGDEKEP